MLNVMSAKKTFYLVTGASKGFGRAVALTFAKLCEVKEGSQMVLVSRSEQGLNETRSLVNKLNGNLVVKVVVADLSNMDTLDDVISQSLDGADESFDNAILVNNAASVGDITKKSQHHTSSEIMRNYFDFNMSSAFLLTAKFMTAFESNKKFVVNISSLCAVQEIAYLSLYCSGKAARDMFFKCLAIENEDTRVLNYSPGPMDTDMGTDMELNCGNEVSRKLFTEMREKKTIIQPDDSAEKMVKVLKNDQYRSGAHIDYYEI